MWIFFNNIVVILEKGMEVVQYTKDIQHYDNSSVLGKMTKAHIEAVFKKSAENVTLVLEPGLTMLQVSLRTKCFKNEGMFYIFNLSNADDPYDH